ncbi:MAG: tripartite tricarboxylate transporter TctB family protein [Synergistaceae bacterium]|nr:tripartite tricarboxylate transporter TctB family protein [Synergistaceae bacterium]
MFKRNDWIFGLISIALACAVLYFSQELKSIQSMDPAGPSAMPTIIAWAMLAIGVLHVAGALNIIKKTPAPANREKEGGLFKVAVVCAICAAYWWWLDEVGYLIMTPLLIFGVMTTVGVRNLKKLLAMSLGTTTVLFCIFYYALQVRMPLGVLGKFFE